MRNRMVKSIFRYLYFLRSYKHLHVPCLATIKFTPPNDFPLGLIRSHMVVIHLFLMLCDLQRVVRDLCPTLYIRITLLRCENKMPTRCSRGFYCRSYCLLNMFRAPLCPSSGAQDYYTVIAVWGLCVRFCRMLHHPANRTHNPQLHTRPRTWKPQHEIPHTATTVWYSWAPDDGPSGVRKILSKQ